MWSCSDSSLHKSLPVSIQHSATSDESPLADSKTWQSFVEPEPRWVFENMRWDTFAYFDIFPCRESLELCQSWLGASGSRAEPWWKPSSPRWVGLCFDNFRWIYASKSGNLFHGVWSRILIVLAIFNSISQTWSHDVSAERTEPPLW